MVNEARLDLEKARELRLQDLYSVFQLCKTLSPDDERQILKVLFNNPLFAERYPFVATRLDGISISDLSIVSRPPNFELIRDRILALNTKFLTAILPSTSGPEVLLAEDKSTTPAEALNISEEDIWRRFIESLGNPVKHRTGFGVRSLIARSDKQSKKLSRRVHLPTASVYAECFELLRTMGVPCIVATGAIEAEALASSLVLHGHADYVASDDNVWGIPLLLDSDT